MTKEKKKGAPQAGLYLRIADDKPFEDAFRDMREAAFVINRSVYEKNLHVLEVGGDPMDVDSTDRLKALVLGGKQNGLVVIVRGHAGLAFAVEADGVFLDKAEDLANAREVMGEDAIIGLRCGLSRQAAEDAEQGGIVLWLTTCVVIPVPSQAAAIAGLTLQGIAFTAAIGLVLTSTRPPA